MNNNYFFVVKTCGSVFTCRNHKISYALNQSNSGEIFDRVCLDFQADKIYNLQNKIIISDDVNKVFTYGYNGCFDLIENQPTIELYKIIIFDDMLTIIDNNCVTWTYCKNKWNVCDFLTPALDILTYGIIYTILLDNDHNLYKIKTKHEHTEKEIIQYLPKIYKISCGFLHAVILDFDKKIWVIGDNKFRQLGLENIKSVTKFTRITYDLPPFSEISCGKFHTCALDVDGKIWICGSNRYGQKGMTTKFSLIETPCIFSIVCTDFNTLALDYSGVLWACGHKNFTNQSECVYISENVIYIQNTTTKLCTYGKSARF